MANIIYSLINYSLIDGIITTDIFASNDISVIIAIDDEISNNALLKEIYNFSICNNYFLEIVTKEEALDILLSNKYKNYRIGLTSRTLDNYVYLLDNGINLGECCLTDSIKNVFPNSIDKETKNINYLKNHNYELGIMMSSISKKTII